MPPTCRGAGGIILLFDKSKPLCFIRSTIYFLCPNINLDVVDFSELHSEEVMFSLTLSVFYCFFS